MKIEKVKWKCTLGTWKEVTMLSSSTTKAEKLWDLFLICLVAMETFLVSLALVPAQMWTRILPLSANAALDGPFPAILAPVITALIYLLPTVIGFLSRTWQRALLYATLPAWIGLGLFVTAATLKVGIFYLVSSDHVMANASVLELFFALGCIGWLARHLFKMS